jgi:hypothetical protein
MATRKLRSPTTGETVEADVVEIVELRDPPLRLVLADGTTLRLRVDVIEVARFNGEWDPEGHPLYNVKSANIMAVLESPEHMRKGAKGKRVQ